MSHLSRIRKSGTGIRHCPLGHIMLSLSTCVRICEQKHSHADVEKIRMSSLNPKCGCTKQCISSGCADRLCISIQRIAKPTSVSDTRQFSRISCNKWPQYVKPSYVPSSIHMLPTLGSLVRLQSNPNGSDNITTRVGRKQ